MERAGGGLGGAVGAFAVATAVNALQFAADYVDALVEAARVAICNWGPPEHRDLFAVLDVLRERPSAAGPTIGDAGESQRRLGGEVGAPAAARGELRAIERARTARVARKPPSGDLM